MGLKTRFSEYGLVGMAMFAALAAGAPIVSFVFDTWSFSGIAVASSVIPFAVFACMLIVTRIFFGHLPDRFGGAVISLYCLVFQSAGLIMIGTTAHAGVAMSGAADLAIFITVYLRLQQIRRPLP